MKTDYLILLAVAACGIAFGLFALRKAIKYKEKRRLKFKSIDRLAGMLFEAGRQPVSIEDMNIMKCSRGDSPDQMTFSLTKGQQQKFKEWKKTMPVSKAADCAQFEFCFIPTGIGTHVQVKCLITNTVLDLTDSSDW